MVLWYGIVIFIIYYYNVENNLFVKHYEDFKKCIALYCRIIFWAIFGSWRNKLELCQMFMAKPQNFRIIFDFEHFKN